MAKKAQLEQLIRRMALAFPEATEGVVCNRAAFEAGKKRFLFLEAKGDTCLVLLKLADSLPAAEKLAKARPECYQVGGSNWVTATFAPGQLPPPGLLQQWIEESYRLLVPKKLVASVKPPEKKSKPNRKRKTQR